MVIDFHTHILPNVDDGPQDLEASLSLLRSSFMQGVDAMIATSHFYAYDEYPEEFIQRRNKAVRDLKDAMLFSTEIFPQIIPGAEVLYFPGISQADGIESLRIGESRSILIEPPMAQWTEDMLDDIWQMGQNFELIPVIAHVDRYMAMLEDETLIDRVLQRKMLVQVNGSYFLSPKHQKNAFRNLKAGKIQLIGSDCHNADSRPQTQKAAWKRARDYDAEAEFRQLHRNAAELLLNGGR